MPAPPARSRTMATAVVVGAVLVAWNNLVHLPAVMDGWPYVPANLALAAALVGAGRGAGLGWRSLGFDPAPTRRSLLVGLAWVGVVALALGIALAVPALRPLLEDGRVAGRSWPDVLRHALYRIPLGTAVLEEVAFRGVFLALLTAATTTRWAVLVSSAVFGLWHIRPAWGMVVANGGEADLAGLAGVAGSVVVTALAGVAFCWVRLRGGNLVGPYVAHAGMNSLATLAAGTAFTLS